MDNKYWLVLLGLFCLIIALRVVLNWFILPSIYTLIIFIVPLAYFLYKKDYYIFYFNTSDTLPSIRVNLVFAIGFITLILVGSLFFKNYSWALLSDKNSLDLILGLLVSFFQEMLFRYFLQGTIVKLTNSTIKSIIFTSVLNGAVFLPSILESIVFLIAGLFIGYIFEKTKDIYGATLANFLISSFIRVIA